MPKRRAEDALSKREAKGVRAIVRSIIPPPEWKCFQKPELKAADVQTVTAVWKPEDLTANIAQGTESSDRIGRSIRVHRVDVWLEARSPQKPAVPALTFSAGLLRAEYPDVADPTSGSYSYDSLWDGFARPYGSGDYLDPRWGVAPPRVDLETTLGWHILRLKRFSLEGAGRRREGVMGDDNIDPLASTTSQIIATHSGFSSTGAGAQNQSGASNTAYNVTLHEGAIRKRIHMSQSFPGKGLYVDYNDDGDADVTQNKKSNHLYFWVVSTVPAASAAALQPSYNYSWRVWFTDE